MNKHHIILGSQDTITSKDLKDTLNHSGHGQTKKYERPFWGQHRKDELMGACDKLTGHTLSCRLKSCFISNEAGTL